MNAKVKKAASGCVNVAVPSFPAQLCVTAGVCEREEATVLNEDFRCKTELEIGGHISPSCHHNIAFL